MAWRVASLLLLAAAVVPAHAGRLYCCEVNGQKTCGDSVPAQCQAKGYKELNAQGVAVREVGPPLTPEQRARQEEEQRRRVEAEAALKEQKRKDMALLNTYSSEKDIDALKARGEQDLLGQIKQSENKLADSQKRLKKYRDELEFYRNKPLPLELDKNFKDTEHEVKSFQELIQRRKQELDQMRAKYDLDKLRYGELTRARAANPASLHPALVQPAPPPAVERPR